MDLANVKTLKKKNEFVFSKRFLFEFSQKVKCILKAQ